MHNNDQRIHRKTSITYTANNISSPEDPQISQYHIIQQNLDKILSVILSHKSTMVNIRVQVPNRLLAWLEKPPS